MKKDKIFFVAIAAFMGFMNSSFGDFDFCANYIGDGPNKKTIRAVAYKDGHIKCLYGVVPDITSVSMPGRYAQPSLGQGTAGGWHNEVTLGAGWMSCGVNSNNLAGDCPFSHMTNDDVD